jgi:vacuolar-type H+-ATPase subunit I/STV1
VNERRAKIAITVIAVVSALLIPLSAFIEMGPFNSTVYAGWTLVAVFLSANPKLLVSAWKENREVAEKGYAVLIALYLGSLLMLLGFVVQVLSNDAT